MKVVIDTNVMISGIFWKGKPYLLLEQWINEQIELIVSQEILDEYMRILQEIGDRYDLQDIAWEWTEFIFQNAQLIDSPKVYKGCRDVSDNKFIDCALAGKSKLVVSGDADLLVLGKVEEIHILRADEALKYIGEKHKK